MRPHLRQPRTMLVLGVGLAVTALGLIAYGTGVFRVLELESVDARFSVRGVQTPPSNLIIVKIDDVTFSDLNLQWPFPRSVHARVINRIARDGARLIAYDVQFSELSSNAHGDLALAQALADAKPRAVVATTEVNSRGDGKFLGAAGVPADIGAGLGNALFPNDPGAIIRRVSYSVARLKTFAVVATERATGRRVDPGIFPNDGAWIDYYGPPGTIRSVSFSQVAQNKLPRGFFRNKLVIVGATAPSLQDVHPTSTVGNDQMTGAELQANAIATVMRGLPLRSAPSALNLALIVLLGLIVPAASLWLSPLRALGLAVGAGVAFTVSVQFAFDAGRIVSFVYPLGTLILVSASELVVQYLNAAYERARTRDLFSRFVPHDVVDQVLARADQDLRLGGVLREGTVMFTDLRGFTRFAESMPPSKVIDVLNRYLSEMSDAILDHGGTLVSYMGDGIMAVFGAPLEQADHADRALAAAREILDHRLPGFNEWLRHEELCEGFRMGIGLNSGPLMSGNVGSERRLEYTAVGDTVNTASRLEAMTKGTPYQLFVAHSTRSMLRLPPPDLIYVDQLKVRERLAQVKIWSLPDHP